MSGSRPVPGAEVSITVSGKRAVTSTDESGRFSIAAEPAIATEIEVRMFGFDPVKKTLQPGEAAKPIALSLAIAAAPTPARRGPGGLPPTQSTATQDASANLDTELTRAMDAPQMAIPDLAQTSESFLVQGSLSQSMERTPREGGPGGPGGGFDGIMFNAAMVGMFNSFAGGDSAPGFASAGGDGGGRGGPGGPGGFGGPPGGPGGGRGGPGGPGGPGGGFGGPPGGPGGGRGGPGGPGGLSREEMKARFDKLPKEQKDRIERVMKERFGVNGGRPQVFGNRTRRTRDAIRGGAFISGRNSAMDAAPYSLTGQDLTKPDYSQLRFGVSAGGTLHIPKLVHDDKTFFFLNYSGTRGNNPFSNFAVLPGAAERAGDFSAARSIIYDLNQAPFPGNRIPASRISPIAAGLLDLIPAANLEGSTQNYRIITSIPQNTDTLSLRLTRSVSRKDRLAFGMSLQRRDSETVQLYGFRDESGGTGRSFDLTWTHNFSTRIIHNARAHYNLNRNTLLPFFAGKRDVSGELGINGNSREPINWGPPNLNFTNYGDLTDGAYLKRRIHSWNFNDGITFIRGNHNYRAGFDLTRLQWNTLTEQNARGTLFFGGLATSAFDGDGLARRGTGIDFADLLLGAPQQSTLRYLGADTYLRAWQYAGFFIDEWRVRPNLTLNTGLRYEFFRPFTEKYSRMSNLDINADFTQVAVVTPGLSGPYTGAFADGLIDSDANNLSPRFGFAWRPFTKKRTLVRGGYSIFFDGSVYNRIPTRLAAQPPFAQTSTFNTGLSAPLTLSYPFTGPADVNIKNTYAVSRALRVPYAQTWNFSIQEELPHALVMELGYTGTKGTRLVMQRLPNRAAPGSPLTTEERRRIEGAVGFNYDTSEGNSIYHGLQARLTRRFRRGVSFNANYVWSKSIDNASSIGGTGNQVVQNERDFAAERGLSVFDRRHVLSVNSFFTSPFGPGGSFLRQRGKASTALRDWTLTIAADMSTGRPFTATVLGNAADPGGSGATGSARADATGLPVQAGGAFFNPLAFRTAAPGTFGNASRNTIPGPGQFVMNLSFGRSFQITDDTRRRIEFRAEADNVLNWVNINGIGTVVNAANYALATRAGNMRSVNLQMRFRF
jgi:hypothetical protein